jgi:hypothetical protein
MVSVDPACYLLVIEVFKRKQTPVGLILHKRANVQSEVVNDKCGVFSR